MFHEIHVNLANIDKVSSKVKKNAIILADGVSIRFRQDKRLLKLDITQNLQMLQQPQQSRIKIIEVIAEIIFDNISSLS